MQLQPRLDRLQAVQEEIYRQLQLLIPEQVAVHDSFASSVSGSPKLRMDILERHAYTKFIRLTYSFENGAGAELAPDAHIRLYRDARLAEATSFDPGQGCRRSAHPWYPRKQLLQRDWRRNLALDKWLGYLLMQGHSVATMLPADEGIKGKQAVPVSVRIE